MENAHSSRERNGPSVFRLLGGQLTVGEMTRGEKDARERKGLRARTETQRKEKGRGGRDLDRCRVIKSRPPSPPLLSPGFSRVFPCPFRLHFSTRDNIRNAHIYS